MKSAKKLLFLSVVLAFVCALIPFSSLSSASANTLLPPVHVIKSTDYQNTENVSFSTENQMLVQGLNYSTANFCFDLEEDDDEDGDKRKFEHINFVLLTTNSVPNISKQSPSIHQLSHHLFLSYHNPLFILFRIIRL